MDRIEFDKLELEEQVDYINNQLATTGISLTNVCKTIGVDRATVRKRFTTKGYVFNKDLNLYEGNIVDNVEGNKQAPKSIKKPSKAVKLEDRVKLLEEQIKVLETAINTLNTCNATNITTTVNTDNSNDTINADTTINTINASNTELSIGKFSNETVSRTYRVYTDVQQDFKLFCRKHSEHTVQDILSSALSEYMDKYK